MLLERIVSQVTHELLGTIKGAKAEAELLRAQLAEVNQ